MSSSVHGQFRVLGLHHRALPHHGVTRLGDSPPATTGRQRRRQSRPSPATRSGRGDSGVFHGEVGPSGKTEPKSIALPCSLLPLRFPSSSSTATAHATAMWGFSGIWRLQQPSVAMWRRQQLSTAAVVLWRKNGDEKLTVLLLRRDQIYFNPIDLHCSLI
ncbi:hypothetical protein MRB53_028305 [Persea americana]|uniref:Uncharacterized protein n=1 Tax=Persea americana TaxID=3435 RepID=A0ACC2KFH9_PERAE|nr:hypothetical protein MRB53_028305 [Persea americana]